MGDRLPPLVLLRAADGARVALRAPERGAPVVVFLATRERGPGYVRALSSAASEFRVWDGRPIAVLPPDAELRAFLPAGSEGDVTVVADPTGEARRRLGLPAGTAAIFIADRWGQIYYSKRAETEDGLPVPAEIEEWLRYLATQCPECGVPDEPGRGGMEP